MIETNPTSFDAVVIGGSYAGLAAALQLARARKRVAVVDAGVRRNRMAAASHGFLGQDGREPGAIVADARAQLLAYPSVTWIEGAATEATGALDAFAVALADGRTLAGRRLVLATGVVDELPDLPGLAARWGRSVFHCPYCHGYELGGGPIGVIATMPMSQHQALLLPDWGPVTYFLNGAASPDDAEAAALAARGVAVEPVPVAALEGDMTPVVVLADGRRLPFAGLFMASRTRPASPLAAQLGCAHDEGPAGPFVRTDEMKATSVPGVFAAGDAARMAGSVTFAVGDGAMAGMAAHRSLLFG